MCIISVTTVQNPTVSACGPHKGAFGRCDQVSYVWFLSRPWLSNTFWRQIQHMQSGVPELHLEDSRVEHDSIEVIKSSGSPPDFKPIRTMPRDFLAVRVRPAPPQVNIMILQPRQLPSQRPRKRPDNLCTQFSSFRTPERRFQLFSRSFRTNGITTNKQRKKKRQLLSIYLPALLS